MLSVHEEFLPRIPVKRVMTVPSLALFFSSRETGAAAADTQWSTTIEATNPRTF